jgi:hypothetical protein
VLLPAGGDLQPRKAAENWAAQASPASGSIRDGPRRRPACPDLTDPSPR